MAEGWMQLVQRVYKEKKAKNSSYKFKQAMVDAKKMYKPGASSEAPSSSEKMTRKQMRKSRNNRKHGKKSRKHHKKHGGKK